MVTRAYSPSHHCAVLLRARFKIGGGGRGEKRPLCFNSKSLLLQRIWSSRGDRHSKNWGRAISRLSLFYLVAFCFRRHSLRQHMLRHAGKKYKCGLPGCPTVLRTASELRSHVSLVHDANPSTRRYKCTDCPYAAKTRTQLRR